MSLTIAFLAISLRIFCCQALLTFLNQTHFYGQLSTAFGKPIFAKPKYIICMPISILNRSPLVDCTFLDFTGAFGKVCRKLLK